MTSNGEVMRLLLKLVDPLVPDYMERHIIMEMVWGKHNWVEYPDMAWPELQKMLVVLSEKGGT